MLPGTKVCWCMEFLLPHKRCQTWEWCKSLSSRENGDPGPHIPRKMGTWVPILPGEWGPGVLNFLGIWGTSAWLTVFPGVYMHIITRILGFPVCLAISPIKRMGPLCMTCRSPITSLLITDLQSLYRIVWYWTVYNSERNTDKLSTSNISWVHLQPTRLN